MLKRYKLTISYDGTAYCGWQVQSARDSIQALIQKALETVLRTPTQLTGSSRTDAGVHALGQTAHFDTSISIDLMRLRLSLNALLPKDIRILSITQESTGFHARYSATSKVYHYHLHLDPILDPCIRLYRCKVRGACHLNKIQEAIPYFLGTQDFTSFANQAQRGCASKDAVRTIQRIDLVEQAGGVRLEFEADGFLYRMVRNLVGTLLEIGKSSIEPEAIKSILAAKDRKKAHSSAPPQGLFLMKVNY